jgi:GTP-dependent phosphoenolpyruvate carboxykinase
MSQIFTEALGERHSMCLIKAYEEFSESIAAGTGPRRVINFQPSEEVRERIADLIYREKTTSLSLEEKAELDHYLQLEHLMRLAKTHARQYVAHRSHDNLAL